MTGEAFMACSRGEVVPINYPYTDLSTSKARPAVVLSGRSYHDEQPDVILGALTLIIAAATDSMDYVLRDWQQAGLRFPTAFKPVIVTLEPNLVVHSIGMVSARYLGEISNRVRLALDL